MRKYEKVVEKYIFYSTFKNATKHLKVFSFSKNMLESENIFCRTNTGEC